MAAITDSDVIQVVALGRPFQLGMIYDCYNDKLIQGGSLWEKSKIEQYTENEIIGCCETEVLSADTANSNFAVLDICERLKLSVMSGLVQATGAGKYLHDMPVTINQERVLFKLKRTTKKETLKADDISEQGDKPNLISASVGTHVVTAISYGAELIFVFDKFCGDEYKSKETSISLMQLVKTIPNIHTIGHLTGEQKALAKQVSIQTYADVMPPKKPTSFEDVLKVYRSSSGLLGEKGEKAVPLVVWLSPIQKGLNQVCLVHHTSSRLSGSIIKAIVELEDANNKILDLLKHRFVRKSQFLKLQLQHLQTLIDLYKNELKEDISVQLPKIRKGECDESALDTILKKHFTSPFGDKKLSSFLQEKQSEVTVLHLFVQAVPKIMYATQPGDLEAIYMDPKNETVFCFVIELPDENSFIRDLETHLHNSCSNYSKAEIPEPEYKCKQTASHIARIARTFRKLYDTKCEKDCTKFVIVEQQTDTSNITANIIAYKDGVQLDEYLDIMEKLNMDKEKHKEKTGKQLGPRVKTNQPNESEHTSQPKQTLTPKDVLNKEGEENQVSSKQSPLMLQNSNIIECLKTGQEGFDKSTGTDTLLPTKQNSDSAQEDFIHTEEENNHSTVELQFKQLSLASTKQGESSTIPSETQEMMEYQDYKHSTQSEPNTPCLPYRNSNDCKNIGRDQTSSQKQGGHELEGQIPLPAPPSGIVISEITHDIVTLIWKKPESCNTTITEYEISGKDINGNEHIMKTRSNMNKYSFRDLEPGKYYQFKIRTCAGSLRGIYGNATNPVQTLPTSPPGKPKVRQISNTTAVLEWARPSRIGMEVTLCSYIVEAKPNGCSKWLEIKRIPTNSTKTEIKIDPALKYIFRVHADCGSEGTSEASRESEVLVPSKIDAAKPVKPSTEATLILDLNHIGGTSPKIQEIITRTTYSNDYDKIRKMEIGPNIKSTLQHEKVILFVGATGSGKSTLINGVVNYVLGVSWKDDSRYQMADPATKQIHTNQAKSQTTFITSYTIHHQAEFRVPYTLTLVDTPGFGDTSGVHRDKEIMKQIKRFFSIGGDMGINHIDAVGFVVQSSLPRLTPTQKSIYDSVLNLFGNDIRGNIFFLLTFSDGQTPQVLDGLKEAHLPFEEKFFKFNNSALFAPNVCNKEDEEAVAAYKLNRMFWKMGTNSFQEFLNHLIHVQPNSLSMTREVLAERDQLEINIQGLHVDIQYALSMLQQLNTEQLLLRQHEENIKKNQDFCYTAIEDSIEEIPVKSGMYTTNCLQCRRTCHFPCVLADKEKSSCRAMETDKDGNRRCWVCPGKCEWHTHRNLPYRYKVIKKTITKTSRSILERYETAKGNKLTSEIIIQYIMDDIFDHKQRVYDLIKQINSSLRRLDEIALKSSKHHTATQFIDILIQSERDEANPGYEMRVEQLKNIRSYAISRTRTSHQ